MMRFLPVTLLSLSLVHPIGAAAPVADEYESPRARLLQEIRIDVQRTRRALGRDRLAEKVFDSLERVPRHEFVPDRYRPNAYENRPLAIGYGQTISQPYIVAIMTDLLEPRSGDVVLEVGTGSGYQAAVLAHLVSKVYTIEIIPGLGERARARLKRLGYDNVSTRVADGYYGWEENAPFDSIIVTAAAGHVPAPLIAQLKPGGRMVIPVGNPFSVQHLLLLTKRVDGKVTTRQVLPVAFVPLTGKR